MFENMKIYTLSFMKIAGIASFLFIVGCEDNNNDTEEHLDAEGFVLESEGTVIYREFKGAVTGSITLKVGGDLDLSVHFLDDDGKEIEHEEHEGEEEEEEELRVSGFNSSIATVEFVEDDHGHSHRKISLKLKGQEDDEHAMVLEVKGVGAGSTSFQLELMHGDHADYKATKLVPIVVTSN